MPLSIRTILVACAGAVVGGAITAYWVRDQANRRQQELQTELGVARKHIGELEAELVKRPATKEEAQALAQDAMSQACDTMLARRRQRAQQDAAILRGESGAQEDRTKIQVTAAMRRAGIDETQTERLVEIARNFVEPRRELLLDLLNQFMGSSDQDFDYKSAAQRLAGQESSARQAFASAVDDDAAMAILSRLQRMVRAPTYLVKAPLGGLGCKKGQ